MSPPTTEILVHIAVPSRVSDDVRYRSLAQAYANFTPARRVDVFSTPDDGGAREDQPGTGTNEQQQEDAGDSLPRRQRSLESPVLSFQSVWDNSESPSLVPAGDAAGRPRPVTPHLRHVFSKRAPPDRPEQTIYVSPTSVIPDSQPENITKVSVAATSRLGAERSLLSLNGSFIPASQETFNSTDVSEQLQSITEPDVPSPDLSALPKRGDPLPSSQSSSEIRSPLSLRTSNTRPNQKAVDRVSRTKPGMVPCSLGTIPSSDAAYQDGPSKASSHPGNIPSSLPEESGRVVFEAVVDDTRRDSVSTVSTTVDALSKRDGFYSPRKRRAPEASPGRQQSTDSRPRSFQKSVSDIGPRPKKAKPASILNGPVGDPISNSDSRESERKAASQSQVLRLGAAPSSRDSHTRILPPEPPVACDHLEPESLITDKLAKLARDLNLSRRYKSYEQLERAVRPFERGFWKLNTSAWPDDLRRRAWAYLAGYVGQGDAGWSVWCSRDPWPHTWIRLHCFGAIAGHMYLLLYLASKRQILSTGAVWMDGSGTPTITVPPRKQGRIEDVM